MSLQVSLGEEEQLTHSRAAAHPTEQAERVLERGPLSPVVWTVDGQAVLRPEAAGAQSHPLLSRGSFI